MTHKGGPRIVITSTFRQAADGMAEFLKLESAGGLLLVATAVLSLMCSNTALRPTADLAALVATASRMSAAINASGIDTCPCHADGVTSNVMLHGDDPTGALRLVDFDEAANTDPAFDIAVTLNEVLSDLSTWPAALEMPNGHMTNAMLARTRCYAFADDLRWGLWGLKMDATSPRRHIEFLKYAQWRLLRCSMAASRMDTDDLLTLI
ncbi:MAG TPA: phosphotransferase [Caballeronia sp.]|nr:phosphotransferase [Caballeronia sp.]